MTNFFSEAWLLAEPGTCWLLVDAPLAESPEGITALVFTERRIACVGHSYGGFAGGMLSAIEPRIAAFVRIGAIPSLARHMQESPAGYWKPFRQRPDFPSLLEEIAAVEAERFLPAAPDLLRAGPAIHQLARHGDDHNFSSVEALRDRLRWLPRRF